MKTCAVDGCGKPTRSNTSELCGMHYHRVYRTGSLELMPKYRKKYLNHSGGYTVIYSDGHPLCQNLKGKYEYEHRIVFFNTYGIGPFKCAWCGSPVNWANMHIDHLDENKKNNDIRNLVASCANCNTKRNGKYKINQVNASGRFYEHNGETLHLSGWAKKLGMSHSALNWRIKNWGLRKALSTPPKKRINAKKW